MKKLLSLMLVAMMLLATLMLTSCDAVMELLQQYITGLVPEVRYTVTEAEWNAAVKMENYTVTSKNEDGTVDVYKFSKDGYISDTEYGKRIYVFKDGNAYYLNQVGDEWVPDSFGMDARTHTPLMLLDGLSFSDFTYDEARKAYVCGEESEVEVVMAFENGVMVKLAMTFIFGEKWITMEYVISDVGTTVVNIPKYTMPDSHVHVEEIIPAVAATCTQTGLTEGKKCSECGTILLHQISTSVVAHTFDDEYDENCNVCGFVREVSCKHAETEVIPAVEATCTSYGFTEGLVCKKCGEILKTTDLIPYAPHTEEVYASAVPATCTATGLTEGKRCSVCKVVLVEQKVTDKIPHNKDIERVNRESTVNTLGLKELICSACGAVALEDIPYKCSEGLMFSLSDDGTYYTVYQGKFNGTELYIPKKYNGIPVTNIGWNAFRDCSSLTMVHIPDMVTTIDSSAFYQCTSLTSITIPDSVTSIGDFAFGYCKSIENVEMGNSVTIIDEGAFYSCESISNIEIPDSVIIIGSNAFDGCKSLVSVAMGNSVTTIGDGAFFSCTLLSDIELPNSLMVIGNSAFSYSSIKNVVIGDLVTSIGGGAFYGCQSLVSVELGISLTNIDRKAFYNCTSLASIVIPDSVISIGDWAFGGCESITSIVMGNSITTIGEDAFYQCRIQSIEIPASVTSIGNGAFFACTSLKDVFYEGDIEDWVRISFGGQLANPLYYSGNLHINNEVVTEVVIPEGTTSIGDYAFNGCCSITSIVIPESVTSIGYLAFSSCQRLESIEVDGNNQYYQSINGSLYSKDGKTFIQYAVRKSDKSFMLPDSVTNIEDFAFAYAIMLKTVIIPESVANMGKYAFYSIRPTIYCEADSKPDGWHEYWNYNGASVVWGYKGE